MLEATTSCSLAGLCFCLLAISAVDLTSSTIFCCTFLPLLLFGCPLFARFLIPSQVKPVAVKRHRKRGRLKTDTTVAYECTRGSVKGAFANDIARDVSASPFKLLPSVDLLHLLIAMGTVLVVAGVVVTALQLSSRAVVRIQDSNILPASVGGASPAVDDSDAVRAIDWDLRLVAAIDSDRAVVIDSDQVVAVNSDVTVGAADDSDRITAVSLDIAIGAADD